MVQNEAVLSSHGIEEALGVNIPTPVGLNQELARLFETKQIPLSISQIPSSQNKKGVIRTIMSCWRKGGESLQQRHAEDDNFDQFLINIDWRADTITLTLREVYQGIGEKNTKGRDDYNNLRRLRDALGVGKRDEIMSGPNRTFYKFNKLSLLQLIVGYFAYKGAV